MKKILSLFMLVVCFAVGANAQISYTIEDGVLTIAGTGEMPDYAKGGAPWYGQSFTTVVIEADVTSIGKYAFQDCYNLECIYYYGNSNLTSSSSKRAFIFSGIVGYSDIVVYTLPGAASWSGLQNANFYFEGNEVLWTLYDGVLSVKSNNANRDGDFVMPDAFVDYLSEVSAIELDGANQLTVNNGLLLADGGSKLLLAADNAVITIPSTVTSIGDYALYGALFMTALHSLPDSAPTLGDNVFYDVDGFLSQYVDLYLTNSYEPDNYLAWTTEYTFKSVNTGTPPTSGSWSASMTWETSGTTLTIIGNGEIPNSNKFVNDWKTLGVKTVVIKDGVTKIGSNVFAGLGATSFTIPASVTSVGANAFYGNGSATYNFNSNIALGGATGISENDATLNLLLNDDDDLAINANTFDKVTYNRTFAIGATGTMIVPFEPTNVPATFKVYTLSSFSNKVMTFEQVERVQANTPYIYKNESGRAVTLSATGEVSLNPVSDEHTAATGSGWEMHGLYKKSTVYTGNSATSAADYNGESAYWTYSSANQDNNGFGVFKNVINRVNVYPYRVYFTGLTFNQVFNNAAGGSVGAYAPERSLSVEFVDLDGTTSITEITIDGAGNIGSAVEEGVYYDLSGRRVENPTTGIYILNGKKVLVK